MINYDKIQQKYGIGQHQSSAIQQKYDFGPSQKTPFFVVR